MIDPLPRGTVRARCVRAANPGIMTLSGTNTWLLSEPTDDTVVVVDPGPAMSEHLRHVVEAVEGDGRQVGAVLLTHDHPDHAEGLPQFLELTGAALIHPEPGPFRVGALELECILTPGHTSDSISFVLPADGALLTGDTVLGRGTTVVAHPDGRLGDYLESLSALLQLVGHRGISELLPGHGPQISSDVHEVLTGYLAHRHQRLDQVRAALDAGATTLDELLAVVYADVDQSLWPAARLSLAAQLDYLGR